MNRNTGAVSYVAGGPRTPRGLGWGGDWEQPGKLTFGFVDGCWNQGAATTFTVSVPSAERYRATFRAARVDTAVALDVVVHENTVPPR